MSAMQKALNLIGDEKGRGGITKLAKHFGIRPWAVSKWKENGVPPERCLDIEIMTEGKVTCHDLRPDVFKNN